MISNENMQIKTFNINILSPHLFWDVDPSKLDPQRNMNQIIGRVLDYGLISDWNYILQYFGIELIAKVATSLRDLDPKTIAFISVLSGIPKEQFRCYTLTQSIPKHWNF